MPRPKQKSLTLLPPAAPKFKADTSWFHVFRDFVHSGACARLGPHAATVLLVIKSFTDFETGESIPSIDTIVEKAGISRRQVILSLAELEKAGYLVRIKDGRSNSYRVRERLQINDTYKRPVAVATWDYLPRAISKTRAELKNFMLEGKVSDDSDSRSVILIEQLNLNLQIVEGGGVGIQNVIGKASDAH